MFHLDLNDSSNVEANEIARNIQSAEPQLTVSMSVTYQYEASSKTELAENWLKSWYIAETLAKHATEYNCTVKEGEDGTGDFQFRFVVKNVKGMARALAEFAQVFDPENDEAGVFVYEEAHEWLEKRGKSSSRFPELEAYYQKDAAMAEAYEHYGETKEDDAEDD